MDNSVLCGFDGRNTATDHTANKSSASGLFQLFKEWSIFICRGVCDEAIDKFVETFFGSFIYGVLKDFLSSFFKDITSSILFKGFGNLFRDNLIENIVGDIIDIGESSDNILDLFTGGSTEKGSFKTAASECSKRASDKSSGRTSGKCCSKSAVVSLFRSKVFVILKSRVDRGVGSSGRSVIGWDGLGSKYASAFC